MRRRLDTIYNLRETTPVDMADFTPPPRIRHHWERQERLEYSADQARAALDQRRKILDDVNTIAAYAKDMRDFLNESELTERRDGYEPVRGVQRLSEGRYWYGPLVFSSQTQTSGRQQPDALPLEDYPSSSKATRLHGIGDSNPHGVVSRQTANRPSQGTGRLCRAFRP